MPHSPAGGKKAAPRAADAIGDLLAETADHLPAVAVVERQQQDDEPAGRETAERAVPLDQHGVGAGACRRDRGGGAGGAAADHQHLGLGEHGRPARRLVDGGATAHDGKATLLPVTDAWPRWLPTRWSRCAAD